MKNKVDKDKVVKIPLTPLGERVLLRALKPEDGERKLASGLILPASVKDESSNSKQGVVVAVGPGKLQDDGSRTPVNVAVGDTVLFSWGDEMKFDDVQYHVVTETNILGIINS